jgi:transcriptional regulator with XRE-family HTH domain
VRGHQLAEMRTAAGLTQAQVAEMLGVSQARVSKIEHGEISGIDIVRSYVGALGGTLDIAAWATTATSARPTWLPRGGPGHREDQEAAGRPRSGAPRAAARSRSVSPFVSPARRDTVVARSGKTTRWTAPPGAE